MRTKTMHRIFIEILSILVFLTYCSVSHAQQDGGPKMVLEEKTYDAKEVKENEVIEHSFKVLNTGDRDLVIERVRPG